MALKPSTSAPGTGAHSVAVPAVKADEGCTLNILAWGTYDTTKPRVRILLAGLREAGAQVTEVHREVWTGVDDKSQIRGLKQRLRFLARWILAYPALLLGFLRAPATTSSWCRISARSTSSCCGPWRDFVACRCVGTPFCPSTTRWWKTAV